MTNSKIADLPINEFKNRCADLIAVVQLNVGSTA